MLILVIKHEISRKTINKNKQQIKYAIDFMDYISVWNAMIVMYINTAEYGTPG